MSESSRDDLVRSALRISAISTSWTLAASTAAVVIGLSSNSLALVAFGVVGIRRGQPRDLDAPPT